MKSVEQIRHMADIRVDEDDLPVRAGLRVIRKNDYDYGLSQDEVMDRNEFIRYYLLQEFELLLMIPEQDPEDDFFIADCGGLCVEGNNRLYLKISLVTSL